MSLFGGSAKTAAGSSTVANGIDVQTSLAGQAIQIVYGCNRASGNLVWYGGFTATQGSSQAGKGGNSGAGGGQYDYHASFILGLCQGPIIGIGRVWASKTTAETLSAAGLTLYDGAIGQAAWPYLGYVAPGQSLGYSGLAYVCAYNYDLGSSAELPNFNFEIQGLLAGSNYPALFDANPALVFADFLTNPYYGSGLPPQFLASLATYQNYCQAQGLWISPVFDQSQDAASQLESIATATNAAFVWSGGQLGIVPYGDLPLAANGAAYEPPQNPLVTLDDDEFIAASGEDPVSVERSRPADQINALSIEYLNRNNGYNPDLVQARDEAAIAAWGLQPGSPASGHFFCDGNAAQVSAQLQLNRQAVRNQYSFKLGWKYCWLDPMDIVALNDPALGLYNQWVRILSVDESDWSGSDGGVLSIKAEEYVTGTGQASLYSFETGSGYQPNYNQPAPASYAPVFLEPTFALTGGDLEVWMAVAGPQGAWSGADVWSSLDGVNYVHLARVTQPARYGILTAPLAAAAVGLDSADSLSVDLSNSGGQLMMSPGLSAAEANTSLCWADNEFLSYATSTLTGGAAYTLGTLNRGQYGTGADAHQAGTAFVRCDDTLAKLSITDSLIGQTLYIKILGRNAWGGGQPGLSDVEPYTYTVTGRAYLEPLPPVTGLNTIFAGDSETLVWNAVTDTRDPDYQIRIGQNWGTAQVAGIVKGTSFAVVTTGTYWVAAHYISPGGTVVFGPASEIPITGSMIVRNLLDQFDEAADGWPGEMDGTVISNGNLQLDGAGNMLVETDFLDDPSFLNLGGWALGGTYTSTVTIDAGRVLDARIAMDYEVNAVSIYDNFLTIPNLSVAGDIFEDSNGPVVSVTPQVAVAQDDGVFAAWQDAAPGKYLGQSFQFRLALATADPAINCVVTAFSVTTDVPDRLDVGTAVIVGSGGLSVTYTSSFNLNPNVQITILEAVYGDQAVLTNAGTSGFTVTIISGANAVSRIINWAAQGF